MKSKTVLLTLAGILAVNTGFAAQDQPQKIPYSESVKSKLEAAASAPAEINHNDSIYFTMNDFYNMKSTKDRIILEKYPTYQQTQLHTCGPAAGLTVLYYYGNKKYDEISLITGMKTKPYPIGSNTKDMSAFFKNIGWYVEDSLSHEPFTEYEDFKNWVIHNLQQNTPILVENVEWGGHWRVIIGYDTLGTDPIDDDILIMTDSYDTSDHNQDGYVINNVERFVDMWFDHSMLPKNQQKQPWIITRPKTFVEEHNETIASILEKSKTAEKTDQIVLVIDHNLSLWNKDSKGWKMDFQSYCGYGRNGLSFDKREGDGKTPVGSFTLPYAMGFTPNLTENIIYRNITPNSQLSSENNDNYNRWIERVGISDESEQLSDYYQYKYALGVGYNIAPVEPGKGSAIFIRCKDYESWNTAGSISLPEDMMLELVKKVHNGAYVIISPTINDIPNIEN